LLILFAHWLEVHAVSEPLADSIRPALEFLACPLKTVVAMPKLTSRQRFEFHVVLGVWGRHHDRLWTCEFEEHSFERREPSLIQMLDDFDNGGSIESR